MDVADGAVAALARTSTKSRIVLISGASSGIGKAAAELFARQGWQVVATMRRPPSGKPPAGTEFLALDVTDEKSIRDAVSYVSKRYGRLDCLVNNAGFAVMGPFERCSPEQAESQFRTNVFGLMALTRAFLPLMRKQDVASMGGRVSFPLYSLYNSSKWAVEGFSESLAYELAPFSVRVKMVEPGMVDTDFYGRSMDKVSDPGDYSAIVKRFQTAMDKAGSSIPPSKVASAILRAAEDRSGKLRFPVGRDAHLLLMMKRFLPERLYFWLFRKLVLGS